MICSSCLWWGWRSDQSGVCGVEDLLRIIWNPVGWSWACVTLGGLDFGSDQESGRVVSVSLVTETGGWHFLNLNARFCRVLHSQLWVLLLQRNKQASLAALWWLSHAWRPLLKPAAGNRAQQGGGGLSCRPAGLCWTLRLHAAQTFRLPRMHRFAFRMETRNSVQSRNTGWVQTADVTGSSTSSLNRSKHWTLSFGPESITTITSLRSFGSAPLTLQSWPVLTVYGWSYKAHTSQIPPPQWFQIGHGPQ